MNKEELQKKLTVVLEENNIKPEDFEVAENEEVLVETAEEEEFDEEYEDVNDDYIDLSDEELSVELFVGGPTIGELNQWREEYGEIYLSDIGDDTFIWRLLTRAEFKEVANKQAGPYEREEQYCALCTIWPENYDFMSGLGKAGVPSILAEEILTKSGFKPNHVPIQL